VVACEVNKLVSVMLTIFKILFRPFRTANMRRQAEQLPGGKHGGFAESKRVPSPAHRCSPRNTLYFAYSIGRNNCKSLNFFPSDAPRFFVCVSG
jgi:hypothetical protein